jgi:hypothetical protein
MYKLIYVTELLLQSSFSNPTELLFYVSCMMYDDWILHYELISFSSKTIIAKTLCICTWLAPYPMASTCTWI